MPKVPPIPELEFISLTYNHAEFSRKLQTLNLQSPDILEFAHHVASCWYALAEEHLDDAKNALNNMRVRAVYSRSYYAAYNASKFARYVVSGAVSLKGNDHSFASANLPGNIPDVAKWSQIITQLYQCRLTADYDNWADSLSGLPLTPSEAVQNASDFVSMIKQYAAATLGLSV